MRTITPLLQKINPWVFGGIAGFVISALLLCGFTLGRVSMQLQARSAFRQISAAGALYSGAPTPWAHPTETPITLEQYQQLRRGMTYAQVKQILGREGYLQHHREYALFDRVSVTTSYKWEWQEADRFAPSFLSVTFENDALTSMQCMR